jgi:hypothetical protein
MYVLSLFDGMSCGMLALERAGIPVTSYHACEIKKSAIKCSETNYPGIIRHGSVVGYTPDYPVDLLIGGSPCQDFSIAKATKGEQWDYGLTGKKSALFYEYLRILNECKPKYFLLENVKMRKESKLELDTFLGVTGRTIDSKYFSFQTRNRTYWTNIPYSTDILDRNISFQDYIGIGNLIEAKVNKTPSREKMWNNGFGRTNVKACENITNKKKIGCLMRKQDRAPNSGLIAYADFCRYLTRRELEAAQTVPLGYTDSVSYNQAQDLLGDGWTVDVIAHIFGGLK